MVKSDCAQDPTLWICTPTHKCVAICNTNADCKSGEVCDQAVCLPPACNDDSECPSGQQCVSGQCSTRIAPTSVASCSVQPATATLHAGESKQFSILAKDSSGKVIAYIPASGEVTWGATGGATAAAGSSALYEAVSAPAGATAGTGTVTATIGTTACTAANLQIYGAPAANTFQVIVASSTDEKPISGATVEVTGSDHTTQTAMTDASGTATISAAVDTANDGATVSVFMQNYSYVTVMGVKGSDVSVFLKPNQKPGVVGNTMTPTDFANLQNLAGTVHIAVNGPSIAGSLIDLSLTTLLGSSVPTMISLGGSTATNVNLPDGIVIGLGQQMFKGTFHVQSDQGLHTVWGLGGNVVLSDVLGVVSSATSGSVDIGAILTALLPVLGRLQSAVSPGIDFTAAAETPGTVTLNYDTLMRITTNVTMPKLPTYMVDGTQTNFDGAFVLAGASYQPQGLVPLGLTAGVDKNTGASSDGKPDGIIDPATMGGTPGQLPLRLAPMHDGLEGSPQLAIALALNFSGLSIGGSSSGSKGPLILSGLVTNPGPILYKNNATNTLTFGTATSFMTVPDTVTITGRTLAISAAPMGADLERLDVTDADNSEWQIYFPPTLTSVPVPAVPSGMADYFTPADGSTPTQTLQSVSLKLKQGVTYQSVFSASGDTADNLTGDIDQFSVRGIKNGM